MAPLRTHDECMAWEARTWRASLRAKLGVRCVDEKHGGRCARLSADQKRTVHEPWCWWEYAVARVYELERQLAR